MIMERLEIARRAIAALGKKGFYVTTFLDSNTCFDIIARKAESTILVKVYENIDSIRKEQGEELAKLSQVLGASCIIIGGKTKVFGLAEGTVYMRYGVPAVTAGTFGRLLEGEGPAARYFKGRRVVDIDSGEMRRKRNELNLSLQELAAKVGVASETLYRFEKGSGASAETAERLEKALHTTGLTRKIGVLEAMPGKKIDIDEVSEERLLEKVRELGVKMALFEHAPFNAFGETERGMLISMGRGKSDIPRKAAELKKTSAATDSDSIIVTKEYKHKSVEGIPIIEEADLETINKAKELKKLILEREKGG